MKLLEKAAEIAKQSMQGARGARMMWEHPQDVVELLKTTPSPVDEDVLQVAWLHDVLEDGKHEDGSPYDAQDLLNAGFSFHVVRDVQALTNPVLGTKAAHLATLPHASYSARIVKVCDRICNLRDGIDSGFSASWKTRYVGEALTYIYPLCNGFDILDFTESPQWSLQGLPKLSSVAWARDLMVKAAADLLNSIKNRT